MGSHFIPANIMFKLIVRLILNAKAQIRINFLTWCLPIISSAKLAAGHNEHVANF